MIEITDGETMLIAGGYGHVGRFIAADMAPRFPDRVAAQLVVLLTWLQVPHQKEKTSFAYKTTINNEVNQ